MRSLLVWVAVAVVVAATGCESGPSTQFDALLATSFRDATIQNAIIRQHTLFPYHFTANSAELNELGAHDLAVLSEHFREHPGQLNVRCGQAPEALYSRRVETVVGLLSDAGVETDRVEIRDALAGGDALASEQVVVILAEAYGLSSAAQTPGQPTQALSD